MLNRRHIRIKVMQSVYAFLQSKNDDLPKEERFLYTSIDRLYDLYVLQLSLLVHVQKMAQKRLAIVKKNHVTTLENSQAFNNFANNKFITIISESDSLQNYITDHKMDVWSDATEYLQIMLDEIKESDLFVKYNSAASNFKTDKEFVIDVFKTIIAPNDKLASFYEDQYIGWVDDLPFVNTIVVKTYASIKENSILILDNLYKDEDDRDFVKELFRKVVLLHTDYDEEIDKKTPNWDYDRIAGIDLILIKMAISEFLHFPSIPTKVTINEYLEIAKDYSSDKSSFFINGVLDKIEKEYQKEGKIKKIGRGLL